MNKQLFRAVSDRIAAEVPELKWIDFDDGTLDMQQERPGVAFPACVFDIDYPDTENETDTEQIVNCRLSFRLAFENQGATNSKSPVRDNALSIFDTIDRLHIALQGWNVVGSFNPLARKSAMRERRRDGYIVYKIEYQTQFLE